MLIKKSLVNYVFHSISEAFIDRSSSTTAFSQYVVVVVAVQVVLLVSSAQLGLLRYKKAPVATADM